MNKNEDTKNQPENARRQCKCETNLKKKKYFTDSQEMQRMKDSNISKNHDYRKDGASV